MDQWDYSSDNVSTLMGSNNILRCNLSMCAGCLCPTRVIRRLKPSQLVNARLIDSYRDRNSINLNGSIDLLDKSIRCEETDGTSEQRV